MRSAAAVLPLALAGLLALSSSPASAQDGVIQGLRKALDTTFSSITTVVTTPSGGRATTTTKSFYPKLRLNLDTLVYPNLRLNAGVVLEVDMLFTDDSLLFGSSQESTITRSLPYFLLRSTNRVLSPGIGYYRREERARVPGALDVKLINEDLPVYLGWRPAGGPRSEFQYVRTNTFDGDRAFRDLTKDFAQLVSNYDYRNLNVHYLGSYLNTSDRIVELETRQKVNSARINYGTSFIDRRLVWAATYNVNHQDLTTVASGDGGEVAIPVIPSAGLASLSDLPATSRLSPNPALIDDNLTGSAGINLGLPVPGTDAQARNLGLDFVTPTEVNRLLVWVDRGLPVQIANYFAWEVYSSADNVTWTREGTVPVAPFGPFENRFEVDFPAVTARYVKVVTRPLAAVVPESSQYQDILVTEVQAFLRRSATETRGRLERTTQNVNTDWRMRILDAPGLFYEGFYLYNGVYGSGVKTDTLSNGMSINHSFARIYSVYGRGAYEQGMRSDGHRDATVTNATFTVNPIPTFRSTLLYNGLDERVAGRQDTRRTMIVQNNAQLYRGVDVLFGFGWNFLTREDGEVAHERLLNLSGTIVPRQNVNLTFSYDETATDRSGIFSGPPQYNTRRGYASLAFDPTRALHLVLGEEVVAVTDAKTRATSNISANWTPFPDGALQVLFAYYEYLRDPEFGTETNLLANVRWNLNRASYIDVSYQKTKTEYVFQTTESRLLSCTVRLFF